VIDENTTVGELLADERTAPIIRQVMLGQSPSGGSGGDSGMMSQEAALQMADAMPLRGMRSFNPESGPMVDALVAMLRDAAR